MKYQIDWVNDTKNTYLYGSQMRFIGRRVIFKNRLMPSGNAIKTWSSKSQFQANRILPELPLLQRGKTYYLTFQGQTKPENSLYLRIAFFDRFQKEISFEVLKEGKSDFVYPLEAYSYSIQLINAGCTEVVFDGLSLSDQAAAEEVLPKDVLAPSADQSHLTVLFLENARQDLQTLKERELFGLSDVLVVADEEALTHFYLDKDFNLSFQKQMQALEKTYARIRFVGYGPRGNLASLYYNYKFPGSQAYVTDDFYDERTYQGLLDDSQVRIDKSLNSLLDRLVYSRDIITYGYTATHDEALALISPTLSYWSQLTYLPFLKPSKTL
ncbi:accessory Sec system protein Asp3 [Streptococcus sp. DD12]|uniref:accessory Sec system protein Asp3 n=1 Tax=Streptococcus sp. DD12 TaxID=1777880 RepID=UPI000791EDFF|nr:accessory Sec system protein Asp3 [Streptococcus sp. DD12]KXT76156.1 Accessory secretory protein Asp3 [Streptococcus sp. DD12]